MKSNLTKKQIRYTKIKRIIDILLSLFALIILSWFLLLVWIITKCTSKGPGFYKQGRIGLHEKVFNIYKFRSMKVGSENIAPSDLTEEQQKEMTTKWGKFMRASSIDELPQLVNILKGDMSFIGPRPGMDKNEEYLYNLRKSQTFNPYDVKPGLSGYAQIHNKRSHDPILKATQDSFYVEHISFKLDCQIFFYTILFAFNIVRGK